MAIQEGVNLLWPSRKQCPHCYVANIDEILMEESLSTIITQNTSLQINHKYHKQEIDSGLSTLLPLLFPKLFVTSQTIAYLNQSFWLI